MEFMEAGGSCSGYAQGAAFQVCVAREASAWKLVVASVPILA